MVANRADSAPLIYARRADSSTPMGRRAVAVLVSALGSVVACGFPRPARLTDGAIGSDGPAAGDSALDASVRYFELGDPSRWTSYRDSMNVTNLSGGTFDGRFLYFATTAGEVIRYDTETPFELRSSWLPYYIGNVVPAATETAYRGAVLANGFVYFAPATSGKLALRYDTSKGFATDSSWATFDMSPVTTGLRPFDGGVFDGQFVYFVPATTDHPLVLRYDTSQSFGSAASWQLYDFATFAAAQPAPFHGGIFDGQHVDLLPGHPVSGTDEMAQYDRVGAFDAAGSWKVLNTYDINANAKNGAHGAFDGTYVYVVPGIGSTIALRQNVQNDFENANQWESFDLTRAAPTIGTYAASAFDGRYIYLIPSSTGTAAILLRYDTQLPFTDPTSWQSYNLSTLDGGGYTSAVFDGHYLYLEPASANAVLRFEARDAAPLPTWFATGSFF